MAMWCSSESTLWYKKWYRPLISNCASFQLCTFQTNHRQSKHTHNCMPFLFEYSAHFKLSGRWHLSETGYCCTNFTDPLRPPPLYCMLLWIGTGISQTDGILQDHQKSAQLEMWGIWSRRFATSMIDLKWAVCTWIQGRWGGDGLMTTQKLDIAMWCSSESTLWYKKWYRPLISNCASFQLCTFQTNHRQSKHTHNCIPFI